MAGTQPDPEPGVEQGEYLRVSQVAELFHVSSKTVVRWAEGGKLPHMLTLGGHRRFPRRDIERLVAQLRRAGGDGA